MNENKTNINWYPGHMAKTKRNITDIISMVDIVIEVIDARIPFSSRIPDLAKTTRNKQNIIVFNKYDLCDQIETDKWIEKYKSEGSIIVKCNSKTSNDYKKVISEVDSLMKDVNKKRVSKGLLPKKAKCLVVGVPNVGKSTLINKLAGRSITGVGNKPGVTRQMNTIKINNQMDLVDTPGILWPKFEDQEVALNLAFSRAIKDEILDIDTLGLKFIEKLMEIEPEKLMARYKLENLGETPLETMEMIGRKRGFILGRQELDYTRIALTVLNEYREGKIGQISLEEPADYMVK